MEHLNLEDNAVIKIDALQIERSASQPQFKSLLSLGWNVVATIPVDDGGRPTIICILSPPVKKKTQTKYFMIMGAFHAVCIFVLFFLYFYRLGS